MSDEIRAAKNLLTVSTIDQLVTKSVGVVKVLAIVGRTRTGKTWAATDWIGTRENEFEHVAYVDCKGIAFDRDAVIAFDGINCDLPKSHYPKFVLDGIDIVVIDEPQCNPVFVREVLIRTATEAGTAAHRMILLLVQDMEILRQLEIKDSIARCYSTQGLQIHFSPT